MNCFEVDFRYVVLFDIRAVFQTCNWNHVQKAGLFYVFFEGSGETFSKISKNLEFQSGTGNTHLFATTPFPQKPKNVANLKFRDRPPKMSCGDWFQNRKT